MYIIVCLNAIDRIRNGPAGRQSPCVCVRTSKALINHQDDVGALGGGAPSGSRMPYKAVCMMEGSGGVEGLWGSEGRRNG